MRAIKLQGFLIKLIYVENTVRDLQNAVDGKLESISLRDDGIMICDREALPKDKPYNNLASLIAGTGVYGDAIIVGTDGKGFSDVPDPFMALMNLPEDYFEQ